MSIHTTLFKSVSILILMLLTMLAWAAAQQLPAEIMAFLGRSLVYAFGWIALAVAVGLMVRR